MNGVVFCLVGIPPHSDTQVSAFSQVFVCVIFSLKMFSLRIIKEFGYLCILCNVVVLPTTTVLSPQGQFGQCVLNGPSPWMECLVHDVFHYDTGQLIMLVG